MNMYVDAVAAEAGTTVRLAPENWSPIVESEHGLKAPAQPARQFVVPEPGAAHRQLSLAVEMMLEPVGDPVLPVPCVPKVVP